MFFVWGVSSSAGFFLVLCKQVVKRDAQTLQLRRHCGRRNVRRAISRARALPDREHLCRHYDGDIWRPVCIGTVMFMPSVAGDKPKQLFPWRMPL